MCAPSPSASWLTGSSIDTPPGACWLMTAYAASDASCDASTEISSDSIHLQGKLSAVAIQPADALAALRRVDLFAGLSEPELNALAGTLHSKRYDAGQVIFLRGDPGSSLYLVRSGRVRVVLTS